VTMTDVTNRKINEDVFMKMRKPVLAQWPTGTEVDLDEAVDYLKKQSSSRSFLKIVQDLHDQGRTVVFPRAGTPVIEDQISLCRKLAASHIPLIPITTDSYTRQLQFERAQVGIESSIAAGKAMLNGYPLINHGVTKTRKVVESVEDCAFSPRLSRLCYPLASEIAFASGMTGIALSAFVSFGAYEKKSTLEESITQCQYVARLMGYYANQGILITADHHGWIPTSVFPLSINIATMIADAVICAEQGVRSVLPLVHSMGNLAQDLGWIRVTPRLMREYLDRLGYKDVIIAGTTAAQTPLYPMPQGAGGAFAFLCYSAILAALGKVETMFIRTIDEGAGVPTEESHTVSYAAANWLFDVIRGQNIEMNIAGCEEEEHIAEVEVRSILDRILDMGEGDIVIGSINAVKDGILDSSMSPNIHVADQVLGAKDSTGAVRYIEFGNLPIPDEAKNFHRRKLAAREKAEQRKIDYNVMVQDFWAFSKGELVGIDD
jgi:methylaspartate mutase epsilon subunit